MMRVIIALVVACAAATAADTITTSLISQQPDGLAAREGAHEAVSSGDGRFVAFQSNAALDPAQAVRELAVFVRDRALGTTRQVPHASSDTRSWASSPLLSAQGNVVYYLAGIDDGTDRYHAEGYDLVSGTRMVFDDYSAPVATTPDGRYVVLETDTHVDWEFLCTVYDRSTGSRRTITVTRNGTVENVFAFAISDDGRYVAHLTYDMGATPDGSGSPWAVFIRDLSSGADTRVMAASAHESWMYTTPDMRYFAYNRLPPSGTGVNNVYLYDRSTGTEVLASRTTSGGLSGGAGVTGVSADGRFVTFGSNDPNFVAGDTNGRFDVFRFDRVTGAVIRVSVPANGVQTSQDTYGGTISRDGQTITFETLATEFPGNPGNWEIYAQRVDSSTPYGGTARTIAGRIYARDYDVGGEGVAYHDSDPVNHGGIYRSDGVDISNSSAAGEPYVAATATGEWLKYTVNVAVAGTYHLTARVSSALNGAGMRLESGASAITGPLPIPNTGGWQNWTVLDLGMVDLHLGVQTLRLVETGGFDIDWLQLDQIYPAPGKFAARINFQPAASARVTGYYVDAGDPYGARGDGYVYGWNSACESRERNVNPNQLLDTLVLMQAPTNPHATWNIAVPNGTYQVKVVLGDPSYFDGSFALRVEGVLTVTGRVSATTPYRQGVATVTVADGNLTLTNDPGSYNTKICYIEVTQQ